MFIMEVGLFFSNKNYDLQYQKLISYLNGVDVINLYQTLIYNKYLRDKRDHLHHPIAVK